MKKILIMFSILFFVGCGGGGGNGDTNTSHGDNTPDGTVIMEIGQYYQVTKGDLIVRAAEDTQVRITHKEDDINSTVGLLSGEAKIIKKQ